MYLNLKVNYVKVLLWQVLEYFGEVLFQRQQGNFDRA